MGEAYNLLVKIKEKCREKNLMENLAISRIGLKSGVVMAQIAEAGKDDPEKVAKLRKAASEVLGEAI